MATLTHDEMQKALRDGRTVILNGRHINHPSQVPSDAELAGSDPDKVEAAKADLQRRVEELQSQLDNLQVQQETLDESGSDEVQPYEAMDRKELATIARFRGLKFDRGTGKDELITLLKSSPLSEPTQPDTEPPVVE